MSEPSTALSSDARELRRGVLVTYAGYVLKLAMPVLLALATRAYGATRWGEFLAVQAVVLIAMRVALLGLDKGLLWWVAARERKDALPGVRPSLVTVTATSLLACALLWLAPSITGSSAREASALRITALALPPYALSELLLHATMGQRRMELQVLVRDTVNPLVQVLAALLLFHLGRGEQGLAWGFVLSHAIGLALASLGFRKLFRGASWPRGEALVLPSGLRRYAAPLWLAEVASSLSLRMDTLALAAYTDAATVGVWGIVSQFATALRQMRKAYDPIVTALAARIAVQHDPARLADTYSYAAQMVSLTQLPVFAALFTLADFVLPLYGPGFEHGYVPLIVLAGAFLISGGTGLAGLIVTGYGRSLLTLLNVLITIVLQLLSLMLLVPRYGLLGAALALGISMGVVNVLQVVQMRVVTGSFNYTARSRFTIGVVASSSMTLVAALALARALALSPWPARATMLVCFAVVYGTAYVIGQRSGVLRAPRASR
jgi:O-antigen/teichoic acid export membrane protein